MVFHSGVCWFEFVFGLSMVGWPAGVWVKCWLLVVCVCFACMLAGFVGFGFAWDYLVLGV